MDLSLCVRRGADEKSLRASGCKENSSEWGLRRMLPA